MKGITFGEYHSYDDFKLLLLEGKEIGSPAVKENKIDVPGADSALDLTDFFGEPKYEDVRHKFPFAAIVPHSEFPSLFSTIKNAIHGKKLRVILDDDPAFYYVGRIHVSGFTSEKNVGMVTVECDCEPYKYKLQPTIVMVTVNGSKTVTLTNSRKRAVPEVTSTAAMTLAFGSSTWTLGAGTFTLPELELVEGANAITLTGTGTVTFVWQEGAL